MYRLVTLSCVVLWSITLLSAQGDTVVTADTSGLTAMIALYQYKLDSLRALMPSDTVSKDTTRHWCFRFAGILGVDFNQFNNWVGQGDDKDVTFSRFTSSLTSHIRWEQERYFWQHRTKLALGWQRYNNATERIGIRRTTDILNMTSQLGTRLSDEVAMSVIGELRTQVVDQMSAPSYLDMSVGVTWLPEDYLQATLHPLNYEASLSRDDSYESSLGAKLIVNYDHEVRHDLRLSSQLSGFMSYEDVRALTNYTWINGLFVKLVNGIGLGVEYALRMSPQETRNLDRNQQSYFIMGLSYVI